MRHVCRSTPRARLVLDLTRDAAIDFPPAISHSPRAAPRSARRHRFHQLEDLMIKSTGLSRVPASLAAAVSLALIAAPRPAAADHRAVFPDTIELPDGFGPEGIAVGLGATIFTGSVATGAIF